MYAKNIRFMPLHWKLANVGRATLCFIENIANVITGFFLGSADITKCLKSQGAGLGCSFRAGKTLRPTPT